VSLPFTVEQIGELANETILRNIILMEQAEDWSDPCGKSGETISPMLTAKSIAAIKRLRYLLALDGSGGPTEEEQEKMRS